MSVMTRRPPTPDDLRGDAWLGGGLTVLGVLSGWLGQIVGFFGDETPDLIWAVVYALVLGGAIAVRRRFPGIVLIVVMLAFFAAQTTRLPELYVGNVSMFIAMYTVGAWIDDRRRALLLRAGVIAGVFVWLLVVAFQSAVGDSELSKAGLFSPFAAYTLMTMLVNAAFFGGAWYFGDRAYAGALSRLVLEERTAELEHERELTAAQAVALDRVRIARELHDVVAHHVSAMGVQSGAARAVLDRDPEAAREALRGVEHEAREALAELRQLLETLRTPDAAAPGDSTIRLDALGDLVAHARDNGLPVTLQVVGDPVPASELVQVNLYRIAQEALTNARRHAGPHATADVRLRYGDDAIELEVSNEGRVLTAPRPGLGLVGMRERALATGGTIELGPRPRGGYLVRVRVPLRAAAGTPVGVPALSACCSSTTTPSCARASA
ncbi:sensor histidine kinase [Microbacterium sp. No. 7]|uniref:sensor histidine kinase n=1 Tax=Microbacterium sp. No. 7 TaxID=1714373 RepID=UPI0009ECA504|nr:sensor histidine kinase [Microbacterium sp. No. 7]